MKFLSFLEKYEKEDVTDVKKFVTESKAKERAILKEAFNNKFPSKTEAVFKFKNEFISESTAPKGIDVSYVNENFDNLLNKLENLTEGEIKIIIHNHEHKEKPDVSIEDESVNLRKRGRPKKVGSDEKSVIYGDDGSIEVPEVISDEVEELDEETMISQLSAMNLSDEELKLASDMAESGEYTGEGKVVDAAKLISKINEIQ